MTGEGERHQKPSATQSALSPAVAPSEWRVIVTLTVPSISSPAGAVTPKVVVEPVSPVDQSVVQDPSSPELIVRVNVNVTGPPPG